MLSNFGTASTLIGVIDLTHAVGGGLLAFGTVGAAAGIVVGGGLVVSAILIVGYMNGC